MDDISFYLRCFGIPLALLFIGIIALFTAGKHSPRRYVYILAGTNVYAMTMIPLFIIMQREFRYTVLSVFIILIVTTSLNIAAERAQPVREMPWILARPLLVSWLIWVGAFLYVNYSFFAGQVIDWGALVFGAVLMVGTPFFFVISLVSVIFSLKLFNQHQERATDSRSLHPYRTNDGYVGSSLSILDILRLSSGQQRAEELEEDRDPH